MALDDRIIDLAQLAKARAIEWKAADFRHTYIALAYWYGNNRSLDPLGAKARRDRLWAYEKLYRGDYSPLGMDASEHMVSGSEFARVADTFTRLLMAYPPSFEGLADEFDVDELLTALNHVVLDIVRYGTGLLYSFPSAGEGLPGGVLRLDPLWWFPSAPRAGAYVMVDPVLPEDGSTPTSASVGIQTFTPLPVGDGTIEERLFGTSPDTYTFSALRASDGEMPQTTIAHEDYPVQTCALPPVVDGWGMSTFEGMVRLVAELSRRMSTTSAILTRHASPHLQAVRDDRAGEYVHVRDAEGRAEMEITTAMLDEQTRQSVILPPNGITRMEYLTWDGNLEGSFRQRESILDEIAAVTALPTALYGIIRGGQVPSGASLRRQYAMTHTTIEALQTMLIPKIQKAIALAGGGDEVVITWLNPLDQLDVMRVEQGAPDEEDEDIRTGEELSAEVAGEDADADEGEEEEEEES